MTDKSSASLNFMRVSPGSRGAYVIVSLGVNVLFLARGYFSMLVLDYRQLGLLAILQTVMALVTAMHFGLLSGGYRRLCSESGDSALEINTVVNSFMALLGIAVLLVGIIVIGFGSWSLVMGFALMGAVVGVLTLLRSWITNQLLATGSLYKLNVANVKAIVISFMPLSLISLAPLSACVVSVVLYPISFILLSWRAQPELRPRSFGCSVPLLRSLMQSGFLLFMTGVFMQLIVQAERWYVVTFLGLESLGRLYLAIMFVTVFQIVPTTLDNVVLPRLVKNYESGNFFAAREELRRLFGLCFGYCFVALILVWMLAELVIKLILPRYVGDLQYVYLMMPGLILLALAGPFGIVFSVLIRHKAYMVAYGGGFVGALVVFGFSAAQGGTLDLQGVASARSVVLAVIALLLVGLYFRTAHYFPALAMHRMSDGRPS
jgi:O-antigen/teichoic acid export membrane protein